MKNFSFSVLEYVFPKHNDLNKLAINTLLTLTYITVGLDGT